LENKLFVEKPLKEDIYHLKENEKLKNLIKKKDQEVEKQKKEIEKQKKEMKKQKSSNNVLICFRRKKSE
jgi:hypothetical protein